jgi:hypothetical protein
MQKDWIGSLKKGDSVFIGMGSWSPPARGVVVAVSHTPHFKAHVQVDGREYVFGPTGDEDSPWPVMDGAYLESLCTLN